MLLRDHLFDHYYLIKYLFESLKVVFVFNFPYVKYNNVIG